MKNELMGKVIENQEEIRSIAASLVGTNESTTEEVKPTSLYEILINSLYLDWAKDRVLEQIYTEDVFELSDLMSYIAEDEEFVDLRHVEAIDRLHNAIFGNSIQMPSSMYQLDMATTNLCNWFRHMIDEYNYNRLSESDFRKAVRTVNIYQNVLMGLYNGLEDYIHEIEDIDTFVYYGFKLEDGGDHANVFDLNFIAEDDLLWASEFTNVNGVSEIIKDEFLNDLKDEYTDYDRLIDMIRTLVREEARDELYAQDVEDENEEIAHEFKLIDVPDKRFKTLDDVVSTISDDAIDVLIKWLRHKVPYMAQEIPYHDKN